MENREKRDRGSNWNHAQTMALAELKRVNEEHGRLVWERIAQTLSRRFPDQIRTGDQCRRRWDTLVKAYNHIEDFCVETGQDHRELDEGELASMKLATAYHPDWYDIVEQVCSQVSQRKSKERCDDDPMPGKRSKSSHSVEHPEHPSNRDSLCSASTSISATCHEQSAPESTTTYAQVFCRPSLEADRLSPEEEVPRFTNGNDGLMLEQLASAYAQVSSGSSFENDNLSPEEEVPRFSNGNDGLMLEQSTTVYAQVSSNPSFVLEATQLRQHGQVSHEASQEPQALESANLLPHTLAAENGAQLEEPLQPLAAENGAQPEEPLQPLAAENGAQLAEPLQTLAAEIGAQHYDPLQLFISDLFHESPRLHYFQGYDLFPSHTRFVEISVDLSSLERMAVPEDDFWDPARDGSLWTFTAAGHSYQTIDDDSTNDDELTIPRKSPLWSLKMIWFFIVAPSHSIAKRIHRKKALILRKEIIPACNVNAASSTSASSATRGDKPLQKDTQNFQASCLI